MEMVMSLVGCSQEEAERALSEHNNDVIEAVDSLLGGGDKRTAPKKKEPDETQQFFKKLRETNDALQASIEAGMKPTSGGQRASSAGQDEMRDLHEETAQQNNCFQQCQLPSLELKAEKQETACPTLSECSFYSQ
jgi:hypothetical protein